MSVKLPTLIRTVSPSVPDGSVIVTPAAVTGTCSETTIESVAFILRLVNG